MPDPQPEDLKDIQGIVISGYGHLACASYMMLRVIEGEAAAARRWLGNITDQITTSDGKQEGTSLNVALTQRGLARLGVDAETLDTFSRPFLEGMATLHRSRILGDDCDNAPANWNWGGTDEAKAVDILLLVFALDEVALETALAEKRAEFPQNGITELLTLGAGRQPDSHEHFGFADGMGQPAIAGTFPAAKALERNRIKTGEFLLGYINDYDKPAESPTVNAARDPQGLLLPPAGDGPSGPTDAGSTGAGDAQGARGAQVAQVAQGAVRDLGRNGTYLVFRQLAQDVALFRHYMDEATRGLDGELDRSASDRLAAKCVGRWQNGAPLVLSPDADDPNLGLEDEFDYRDSDPHGFKCPIGSHVRRSNPRDSLGSDGAKALKSANRHRILRRGRSYGHRPVDPRIPDGVDRGLLFLCLNSDIERQFEFVQHTWINNPVFGGLDGEVDPLIGNVSRTETPVTSASQGTSSGSGSSGNRSANNGSFQSDAIFTVQADPLRTRVHNLERFVTVKGGAYFFLPSIRALRYLATIGTVVSA